MKGQKPAPPPSSEAAAPAPETAWYVGRDGQQYGPVADAEFRRMFEVGQLLPTDLVWREGFPEWRAAGLPVETLPVP